jgi:N-acetylglucosaminyl-diphospho-decaprenol L-rhamnosyltransferase
MSGDPAREAGIPLFSIVVVTWECAGHLRALVESMVAHLPHGAELVVVDNASSDDPAAAARTWPGERRFIGLERNVGFGAAANSGVEAAGGEGVVLLNPDTVLLDARIANLVELALRRRALAGPRLLNPDRSTQPSASGPPVGAWPWIGALVPGRIQPASLRARTEPWRLDRTLRVAWLTGACVAAPRSALLELGPFDASIHMYAEDMDLCLRAARAGVPSYFCPDVCRIVHLGGASAATLYPEGSERTIAANRRAVLERVYGGRRERSAWLAHRLNLRLRLIAKRALGCDARRERAALEAARAARSAGGASRSI